MSRIRVCAAAIAAAGCAWSSTRADNFVNWENPTVHPVDITPDGNRLLVVNLPDARLEVFDIRRALPVHLGSVPVGVDPVSVRARTNTEAWVVNHISDGISVVDLFAMNVVRTIATLDEPADVVFAGEQRRAYVTCSQVNTVLVFDPTDPAAPIAEIEIEAEDPRALAVSPDGRYVYAAIFESGNGSTILSGTSRAGGSNVVTNPVGPYGGRNPPPNDGDSFNPPINPDLPPPPAVGLIVKKDANGRWMDDNEHDWTDVVSGPNAHLSLRPVGWDVIDRDVAIIDTQDHQVAYAERLMNLCMAIAVNPASGQVSVVGTDAINEIRFEPVVKGRFIRVNAASLDGASPESPVVHDLNPHLTYELQTVPQEERQFSIGDPRAIVWNADGTRGYVAGMGSNNVVVLDARGARDESIDPIEVGEGPTGLALDNTRGRLYVLNRFASSISVIDTCTSIEVTRVALHDPSPTAITAGRRHLYDTHRTSGLGHVACGSCHVDARIDRLAWDLGDPTGEIKEFNQNCQGGVNELFGESPCEDWHPMKGPMTTQTLQDIIGKEPLHWRGDRDGIEEFNPAFVGLQGDDEMLTDAEMAEFRAFLATIHFPPNPYRDLDNSLREDLPLPGHFSSGRFTPIGTPLPHGNAVNGLDLFRNGKLAEGIDCVTCHTIPTGMGTNFAIDGAHFDPLQPGPHGELHHAIRALPDGSFKVPQLRNVYDKVGMEGTTLQSRAGFGFFHDGGVDSIARFVSLPLFPIESEQQVADVVAFVLSLSGSDLPTGSPLTPRELPGTASQDTHAAVGVQVTAGVENDVSRERRGLLDLLMALADEERIGLIAKGVQNGKLRGYTYMRRGAFAADRAGERVRAEALLRAAGEGQEVTFTAVPSGTEIRWGIDRDVDGWLDRDELDACSDPADGASVPANAAITGDATQDGEIDVIDYGALFDCLHSTGLDPMDRCRCSFDFDGSDSLDLADFAVMQVRFGGTIGAGKGAP